MQICLLLIFDAYTKSKEGANLKRKEKKSNKTRKTLTISIFCDTLCQSFPYVFFFHGRMCDIAHHFPHAPEPFQRILRFQHVDISFYRTFHGEGF